MSPMRNGVVSKTSWNSLRKKNCAIALKNWIHLHLAIMWIMPRLRAYKKRGKIQHRLLRSLKVAKKWTQPLKRLTTLKRTKNASPRWKRCTTCSSRWKERTNLTKMAKSKTMSISWLTMRRKLCRVKRERHPICRNSCRDLLWKSTSLLSWHHSL